MRYLAALLAASLAAASPMGQFGRAAAQSAAADAARGNPIADIPLQSLAAMRERPLFAPTRRPALAQAPAPALSPPPAGPQTPPFELVGAVVGGAANVAILRNPSTQAITRLREGEIGEGWRAQKVSARSVVLVNGGLAATLEMPAFPHVNSTP